MDRIEKTRNVTSKFVYLVALTIILSHLTIVPANADVGDGGTLVATVRDATNHQTITVTDPNGIRKMEIWANGATYATFETPGKSIKIVVMDSQYPLKVKVYDCQGPPLKEINEFLGITAAGANLAAPNSEIGVPASESGCRGGGITESPDRLAILMPYFGVLLAFITAVAIVYVRRKYRKYT